MRALLFLFGVLSLLTGIMFIYAPNLILKFNAWMRKMVFNDSWALYNRKKVGFACIIFSLLIIYFVFNFRVPEIGIPSMRGTRMKLFKAYTNFYSKNYDFSRSLCEEILAAEPSNKNAMELIALIYSTKGETNKSIPFCKKVLAIDPNNIKIKKIMEGFKNEQN